MMSLQCHQSEQQRALFQGKSREFGQKNRHYLQQFNDIVPSSQLAQRYQQQKQQRLELVERNILSQENKNQSGRTSRLDRSVPYSVQYYNDRMQNRGARLGSDYTLESRQIRQSRGSPIPMSIGSQNPYAIDLQREAIFSPNSVSHHNSHQLRNVFQHSIDKPQFTKEHYRDEKRTPRMSYNFSPSSKHQILGYPHSPNRLPPMCKQKMSLAPSQRRFQTQRSNSQSPSNLKEELKIYEKPLNPHYSQKLKQEVEHSHNLNQQFDLKNLDIKTDGSVVKYKPEYHKSSVQNITRIFPQLDSGEDQKESRGVLSTPLWNEKRFRVAVERREKGKRQINQRRERLKQLLMREQHI